MARPTLRELARQLGLSYSTVSLALRGDPRLRAETVRRVQALARTTGYQSDPIVSEGLSRVRRKAFYRETVAWCCDLPRREMGWLHPLFDAAEERGKLLGYRVDFFHFESGDPKALARLSRIWQARGIRGVFLGPFLQRREKLAFPWESFIWVRIGDSLDRPILHRVGRDYESDLAYALERLTRLGYRRPGFLEVTPDKTIFSAPMLHGAWSYYDGKAGHPASPYFTCLPTEPGRLTRWLKQSRPDCLIVPGTLHKFSSTIRACVGNLPLVMLSAGGPEEESLFGFEANYGTIGQMALNFMHHLLLNGEYGIPRHIQTMLVASRATGG